MGRLVAPIPPDRRVRRFAQLGTGLVLYGVTASMLVLAGLGLDPWDVLHQGHVAHLRAGDRHVGDHRQRARAGLRLGAAAPAPGHRHGHQRRGGGARHGRRSSRWSIRPMRCGHASPCCRRRGRQRRSPPASTSAPASAPAPVTASAPASRRAATRCASCAPRSRDRSWSPAFCSAARWGWAPSCMRWPSGPITHHTIPALVIGRRRPREATMAPLAPVAAKVRD